MDPENWMTEVTLIGISLGSSSDLTFKIVDPNSPSNVIYEKVASKNKITWFDFDFLADNILNELKFQETTLEIRKMLYLINRADVDLKSYDLSLDSCLLTVEASYDIIIFADYQFGSDGTTSKP